MSDDPLEFDWDELISQLDDPSIARDTVSTDRASVSIAPDGMVTCVIRFPPDMMHHFQIASMHMFDHTCRVGEGFAHHLLNIFSGMAAEIAEPWGIWRDHHPQQVRSKGWEHVDLEQPPTPQQMYSCGAD